MSDTVQEFTSSEAEESSQVGGKKTAPDGSPFDGKPEPKEETRSKMAILFVLGFFSILFLCFVYAIKVDAKLGDLKDTLVGVIGALSGILGFIVGYYYKTAQES